MSTCNPLQAAELPLLGSNQDSPDPESEHATGGVFLSQTPSRPLTTGNDPNGRESHTEYHTVPSERFV